MAWISLTRSKIDAAVRYRRRTRLLRSQLAWKITTSIAHNYPANARFRIVRLGILNTKGLEGSGTSDPLCESSQKQPESFGEAFEITTPFRSVRMTWGGLGLWFPTSPKPGDLHPSDEDPSPGTPNMGRPHRCWEGWVTRLRRRRRRRERSAWWEFLNRQPFQWSRRRPLR
jgi:hypothetical protein